MPPQLQQLVAEPIVGLGEQLGGRTTQLQAGKVVPVEKPGLLLELEPQLAQHHTAFCDLLSSCFGLRGVDPVSI